MHGVVLLAIFGFCVVLAQAIAARRPLPAVLVVIAGAGWPATLSPVAQHRVRRRDPGRGAVGARRPALRAASSGARRRRRARHRRRGRRELRGRRQGGRALAGSSWERRAAWVSPSPSATSGTRTYGGIEFPKKSDDRAADHGPEARALLAGDDARPVRRRPLAREPDAALDRAGERQAPERPAPARALARPRHLDPPGRRGGRAPRHPRHRSRAARRARGTEPGQRLPPLGRPRAGLQRPQARTELHGLQLRAAARSGRAGSRSRPSTRRRSTASSTSAARRVEPFGVARPRRGSSTASSRTIATSRSGRTRRCGRRRAGCGPTRGRPTARSSRSRRWLRSTGGFTYDENPPATGGLPPLAHFVAEGKRGYCQHFAGAMALMLRLLGIPARVAAGFTSGKYEDGGWTVTDHNAHAWVEVWFPGYGWLAFDPTPGRGSLAANYSASSTGFNAGDAADAFGPRRRAGATAAAPTSCACSSRRSGSRSRPRPGAAPATRGGSDAVAARPGRARRRRRARPGQARRGGAAATSRGTRDVWPARPAASSSTSSPTRESRSARA